MTNFTYKGYFSNEDDIFSFETYAHSPFEAYFLLMAELINSGKKGTFDLMKCGEEEYFPLQLQEESLFFQRKRCDVCNKYASVLYKDFISTTGSDGSDTIHTVYKCEKCQ